MTQRAILRFAAAARVTGVTPDELKELAARELDALRLIARWRTGDVRELR